MDPPVPIYESLNDNLRSLRLIEVLPPSHDNLVRIHMRQVQTPVKYRCLSYTWGDATKEYQILVNGLPVYVRRNLYMFLRTTQRRYANQPLWIDALSINQNDDAEKSHQVQRMGEIYSCAEAVLIWLGVEPTLKSLFHFSNLALKTQLRDPTALAALVGTQKEGMLASVFRCLCANPYWVRTWLTQEILLAQKIIIVNGTEEMGWDSFSVAVNAVMDYPTYGTAPSSWKFLLDSPVAHFVQHWSPRLAMRGESTTRSVFFELLSWLSESKCGDARDRIYGLLSLVEGGQTFTVDYEENACSLFWRAGEHFRAWKKQKTVGLLFKTLGLTVSDLEKDQDSTLQKASPQIVPPVAQTYQSYKYISRMYVALHVNARQLRPTTLSARSTIDLLQSVGISFDSYCSDDVLVRLHNSGNVSVIYCFDSFIGCTDLGSWKADGGYTLKIPVKHVLLQAAETLVAGD
jgi:hypothetical protein